MTDGQAPDESPWSRQHAETGGWPPPAPDQHRYEPGSPRPPAPDGQSPESGTPGAGPHPATGPGAPGPGSPHTGSPGPGNPGSRPPGSGPPGSGNPGSGPPGSGNPGSGPPGSGNPGAGSAGGGPGTGSPGAGTPGGRPAAGAGPGGGSWNAPWAPGDSAYGRLTGPADRPAGRTRPARPWDGRPERPPRPVPRPASARSAGTPVTFALIAACVLGFLLQEADPSITVRYGLLPVAVESGGQYERLITAAFLHAGVLHLATNMLTLYVVGTPLERVLGTVRYLVVYLLSALGGSLLSLWLSPAWSLGVGASGAIFGLFGALVVLRRQVGADARGLGVLIGLNLAISFAVPNVSWQAHIGGLVTGLLVALVLAAATRARRRVP